MAVYSYLLLLIPIIVGQGLRELSEWKLYARRSVQFMQSCVPVGGGLIAGIATNLNMTNPQIRLHDAVLIVSSIVCAFVHLEELSD
jgi:hypothetical protein